MQVRRGTMATTNLSRIIKNIEDLPTLPRNVLAITELVNNPQSSARDLAGLITEDQVLTARLLKLVNSAFYGFPRRIATVTGAIVLLGFDAIRNLLLTTSLFDFFSGQRDNGSFKREALWDHSLGCAVGAKAIGAYLGYEKIEELFVSGLLHDIGKIVEMVFLRKDFEKVNTVVGVEDILFVEAEERLLEYTHAEVGKILAEQWSLPLKHVDAIAYHHEPHRSEQFAVESSIVHLADILCRALNFGSGGDKKIPPLNQHVLKILELEMNAVEPIMEKVEHEFCDIQSFSEHF